jgi:hypothetical protein
MTRAKVIVFEKGTSNRHEYDVLSAKHRENGRRKPDEFECVLPMGARAEEGDEIYFIEDIADLDFCDLIYNFQFTGYNDRVPKLSDMNDIINERFSNNIPGKFYGQWALEFDPSQSWNRLFSASDSGRINLSGQFDIYVWFTPSGTQTDDKPIIYSKTDGTRGIEVGFDRTGATWRPFARIYNGTLINALKGSSTEVVHSKPNLVRVYRGFDNVIRLECMGIDDDETYTDGNSLQNSEVSYVGGSSQVGNSANFYGFVHQVRVYTGNILSREDADTIVRAKPQPYTLKFGGKVWRSDDSTIVKKVHALSWASAFSSWIVTPYSIKSNYDNFKNASSKTGWNGVINAVKFTGLLPNTSITGIKLDITAVAGSVRVKIYSDNGGNPNILLGESNSIAVPGTGLRSFSLISPVTVPESGIVWAAFETNNSSLGLTYTTGSSGVLKTVSHSYGAGVNPFGSPTNGTAEFRCVVNILGALDPDGVFRLNNIYTGGQNTIDILRDMVENLDSSFRVKGNTAGITLLGGFEAIGKFSNLVQILASTSLFNFYTTPRKVLILESIFGIQTNYTFSQDDEGNRYDISNDSKNVNQLINDLTVIEYSGKEINFRSVQSGDGIHSYRINVPQFFDMSDLELLALVIVILNNEVAPSYIIRVRTPINHVRYNHLVHIKNSIKGIDSTEIVESVERTYPSGMTTIWVGKHPIDYFETLKKESQVIDGLQNVTV